MMGLLSRLLSDRRAVIAGMCGVLAAAFVIYFRTLTNNDVAWYLLATDKWWSGARLYDDIIEVNPPLVFYLDMPAVVLARLVGCPLTEAFVVCVFALIAMSLVLTWRVTGSGIGHNAMLGRGLTLAVLVVLVLFPTWDFGQREHLMLALGLPYILLTIRRGLGSPCDRPTAVLIGVLAGVSFSLKPHFLVLPALLEAYLAWRGRSLRSCFRIEAAMLAIVAALYAVSIPLLTPDYLGRVVPYALLVYGQGLMSSFVAVALCWQAAAVVMLAAFHLKTRSQQAQPEICDVLVIASVAFFFIYVVQMKGWSYQALPVSAMIFLATAMLCVADPLRRGNFGARPALGVLALAGMMMIFFTRGTYENGVARVLLPPVREYAAGSSLFVFSAYVWVGFPLANEAGVRWPSRFPSMWLLPGAERRLHSEEAESNPALGAALREIERYMVDSVVADFIKDPPSVVVVDARPDPRFGGAVFDYLSYFGRDERFREIWSRYRQVDQVSVEDLGPYKIFLRTSPDLASMDAASVRRRR
jgi:hypothetical protein